MWENCGGGGKSVRVSEVFEGVLRGGEEWERRRSWEKCRGVWRTGRVVEVVGGVRRSREEQVGVGREKWGGNGGRGVEWSAEGWSGMRACGGVGRRAVEERGELWRFWQGA